MKIGSSKLRLLTAMVTPMKADLSIDFAKAEQLADFLIAHGSDGLVVAGTTGESPTLTKEEKLELFAAVKSASGGRAAIIAGTGGNDTASSIDLTLKAEKLGVDGCMLVTPYYNKPPQAGLFRHFSMIAEKTALPILLYVVPGRTGVNMTSETTVSLARKYPNIVAVKEASGSLDQAAEIVSGAPEGFSVLSGDDNLTLPLMSVGADGIVSVASHICGNEIRQMVYDFAKGDAASAARMHRRLLPVFKSMFITTNPIPVKASLSLVGIDAGPVRPPLVDITPAEMEKVRSAAKSAGLI